MPFTIAHIAVVLPLKKSKWFSLTALIAGSIVPDFEFLLQMREVGILGHYWYGIFLFDFPMALLFCFIFHNLLRNSLVQNMPVAIRNRFSSIKNFNWNNYAAVNKSKIVLSLFAGIISHILLDGFTHHDGIFVEKLPALSTITGLVNGPVYFLLQVILSITGMITLLIYLIKMPQQPNNENDLEQNKIYWILFSVIFSAILLIRLIIWPQYNTFCGILIAVLGATCYTWILVSILFNNYLQKYTSL